MIDITFRTLEYFTERKLLKYKDLFTNIFEAPQVIANIVEISH